MSRRLWLVLVCVLATGVTAPVAVAGGGNFGITTKKARSVILSKYVKPKALAYSNKNNPHGTPTNWGVVKRADCVVVNKYTVDCAWGIFWADGYECFSLRRVVGVTDPNGRKFYQQKNQQPIACDEDGTTNGGTSTAGTATDIDPSGEGPREPVENDEDPE